MTQHPESHLSSSSLICVVGDMARRSSSCFLRMSCCEAKKTSWSKFSNNHLMTQKTIDQLITIQYICSVNVKLKEKLPGNTECVYILSKIYRLIHKMLTLTVLKRKYSGRCRSTSWLLIFWFLMSPGQSLCLLSGKASYIHISWNLEAARLFSQSSSISFKFDRHPTRNAAESKATVEC